jgi:ABC-type nitrate/sulfonate/bicarbonate transport system permease component
MGWVLGVTALIVVAVSPKARPSGRDVLLAVGIAIVVGLILGFTVWHFVPLERRLEVLRAINPRIASRLLRRRD